MSNELIDLRYGKIPTGFLKFHKNKIVACPKCSNRVLIYSTTRLLGNSKLVIQYQCQNCSFIFYPDRTYEKQKKKKKIYY
jgi:DNA-directed RNA polymerase subunit RPC12/RpoP